MTLRIVSPKNEICINRLYARPVTHDEILRAAENRQIFAGPPHDVASIFGYEWRRGGGASFSVYLRPTKASNGGATVMARGSSDENRLGTEAPVT